MAFEERERKSLKLRTEKFIKLGKEKHGRNRYDYSLARLEYKNNRIPVHLICNKCKGEPFLVYPFAHTCSGDNEKGTCPNCYVPKQTVQETRWNPNLPERRDNFVSMVNKKYKDSLLLPNVKDEYKEESSEITVICKKCKSKPFKRLARSLKAKDRKGGCEVCNKKENQKKTNETLRKRQLRNHATKDQPRDYGCIYKITNTKNYKFYIGYTTMSAEKRFKAHLDEAIKAAKGNKKAKSYLHSAMTFHGHENFSLETLQEFKDITPTKLGRIEMQYIAKMDPNYNISPGGELGHYKTDT
ncbi:MAG: hypothetical protein GQ531_10355 [Sulfurovum sp.]|nr:hypothetical protein [Sulfurovum sp.]